MTPEERLLKSAYFWAWLHDAPGTPVGPMRYPIPVDGFGPMRVGIVHKERWRGPAPWTHEPAVYLWNVATVRGEPIAESESWRVPLQRPRSYTP